MGAFRIPPVRGPSRQHESPVSGCKPTLYSVLTHTFHRQPKYKGSIAWTIRSLSWLHFNELCSRQV